MAKIEMELILNVHYLGKLMSQFVEEKRKNGEQIGMESPAHGQNYLLKIDDGPGSLHFNLRDHDRCFLAKISSDDSGEEIIYTVEIEHTVEPKGGPYDYAKSERIAKDFVFYVLDVLKFKNVKHS